MSFSGKAVKLWSNSDCTAWIDSLTTVPSDIKEALNKEFANNSYGGEDLLDICVDAQAVRAQIHDVLPNVKPTNAKKVVKALIAFNATFTVFVSIRNKILRVGNMTSSSLVSDLKAAISDAEGFKGMKFILHMNQELGDKVMLTSVSATYVYLCCFNTEHIGTLWNL